MSSKKQASLASLFASKQAAEPKPDEDGPSLQQEPAHLQQKPGEGKEIVDEVTALTNNMSIGTKVSAEEVKRAMGRKVQVVVPSRRKKPSLLPGQSTLSFVKTATPKKAEPVNPEPTPEESPSEPDAGSAQRAPAAKPEPAPISLGTFSTPPEDDSDRDPELQDFLSRELDLTPAVSSPPAPLSAAPSAAPSSPLFLSGDSDLEPLSGSVGRRRLRKNDSIAPSIASTAHSSDLEPLSGGGRKRGRARYTFDEALLSALDSSDEDEAPPMRTRRKRIASDSDESALAASNSDGDDDDASEAGASGVDEDLLPDLDGDIAVEETDTGDALRDAFLTADVESDGMEVDEDELEPKGKKGRAAPAKRKAPAKRETTSDDHGIAGINSGKGPDFSLPPLTSIETIFDDMVQKAVEFKNGLGAAVEGLDERVLRVATMCSGTESPLLALSLINSSLEMLGLKNIKVDHQFSAEIEPFKQAYIDRNFRVPILFRDVVEMARSGCTKATTAYGSVVDIPGNIDMLVVGFSCVDYSNLNNYKKSMEEMGQSGATFKAVLTYAKVQKPKMILVENVDGAEWDKISQCFDSVGYEARHARVDTKLYYLPQTRCRGYMICLLRETYGKGAAGSVNRWADLMGDFKRRTSAAFKDFVLPDDDHRIRKARWERAEATGNTILWEACQGRHEAERVSERLGRKRELLRWVDGGSCIAPEYADKSWLGRMPERVWDLMELLNLKSALRHAFDFQFKSQVFDLSQNPDRINQVCPNGLASCITPRGMLYVGDKGRCLTGYEMLSLQGIPIDRISLSHETDDELRDLAGNAMTSTVVGAGILAGLIVGWKGLTSTTKSDKTSETEPHDAVSLALPANLSNDMTSTSILESLNNEPLPSALTGTWKGWSGSEIKSMLKDAGLSARMCYCEGVDAVTHHSIQACSFCKHTTCVQCGKRPVHDYKVWRGGRLGVPEWRRRWGGGWPVRLLVNRAASTETGNKTLKERLATLLNSSLAHPLSLVRFKRGPVWRVEYESASMRLEIHLEEHPMMYLYVKPAREWAGSDDLRRLVERWPVAKSKFPDGMYELRGVQQEEDPWVWLDLPVADPPKKSIFTERIQKDAPAINITSIGHALPSHRSRMGLVDYAKEIQPAKLRIEADTFDATSRDSLSGEYTLLPECGTAFSSLYKREDGMFLFLSSTPLGNGSNDQFIFSRVHGRLEYREIRPIVACIDSKWRPWDGQGVSSDYSIDQQLDWSWTFCVDMPGNYVAIQTKVVVPPVPLELKAWSETTESIAMPVINEKMVNVRSCLAPTPLLAMKVRLPDASSNARHGLKKQYAVTDAAFATLFSWAFLAVREVGSLGHWHQLDSPGASSDDSPDGAVCGTCPTCAPVKPTIRWLPKPGKGLAKTALKGLKAGKGTSAAINKAAGTGGPLVPTEDAREAGLYEAQLKALPEKVIAWVNQPKLDFTGGEGSDECTVTISASLKMMSHQSSSRLVSDTLKTALRYKLVDLKSIASNWRVETDYIPSSSAALPPFVLSSNAEDVAADQPPEFLLPLRVDQRRSLKWMREQEGVVYPTGGESPLDVSQIEFKQGVPFQVFDADEACAPGVGWRVEVRSSATVNVRGGVVADQVSYGKTVTALALIHGDNEAKAQFDALDGLVKTEATLVVCPRHLTAQWHGEVFKFLPSKMYKQRGAVLEITSPAELLAIPGQAIVNARIVILSWDVLAHDNYIDAVVSALGKDAEPASRSGRSFADFCSGLAGRVQEVASSLGEQAILESGVKVVKGKKTSASGRVPTLLQFFHFRRVIVDEFSYLAEVKGTKPGISAQLSTLAAHSRWVLSGTPPLASFSDVDRMARLLGFSIGAELPTPADLRAQGRDQYSKTEVFSAFQQSRSPSWHADRHALAQKFLHTFVRQNEARLDDPIDGVSCYNYVVPLRLAPIHRAVYLELAQHVNAMDMKLRKANDASDRAGRLNRSLAGCATAEEALLNCAAAFDPRVSIDTILEAREQGVRESRREITKQVEESAELKLLLGSKDTHFTEWKASVSKNSVGDAHVTALFKSIFSEAEKRAAKMGKKGKATDGMVRSLRDLVVALRIMTKEITMRMRSLRFLKNVRLLATLGNAAPGTLPEESLNELKCANGCKPGMEELRILSFCGHMVCTKCDTSKPDAESCPVDACAAHSHENAIVTLVDLVDGSTTGGPTTPNEKSFGAKLDHAANLITSLADEERALLFVPTDALAQTAGSMCRARNIQCAVVDGGTSMSSTSPTSAITSFLAPDSKIKVLILNHSSESAAGTNLVRASHILFLSPTLSPNQHAYDSRMRQAIGRARRYGQKRPVHVYLYAAARTIDVDVWEMRERRSVVLHCAPERLPGRLTGFVSGEGKKRRAGVFEYFPPEFSLPKPGQEDEEEDEEALPPLEPVRLARVRWRGKEEIALVPRGLLDRSAREEEEGIPTEATEAEEWNDENDSLSQAVQKANDVAPVGKERFTSLIKFSAAFQGV